MKKHNTWEKINIYIYLCVCIQGYVSHPAIYECQKPYGDTPTLRRWTGKLKMDGMAPSLSRTVWPVLSKLSCLKCSLQSTDESLAAKPFLLKATSHFFLISLSLGNLQNENESVYTKTFCESKSKNIFLFSSSSFKFHRTFRQQNTKAAETE